MGDGREKGKSVGYTKKEKKEYSPETRMYAADWLISDLISIQNAFPNSPDTPLQGNARYANALVNWLVVRQSVKHSDKITTRKKDGTIVPPKSINLTSYDAVIGNAIGMFEGYGITDFSPKMPEPGKYSSTGKPSACYSSAKN